MKMDFRKMKLSNFNINMINTSFALDHKIHLGALTQILEENSECIVTYEPSIHAGINIKINREENDDKKATILVFQSNDPSKMCNLIITGVTNEHHILKAYNFISQILELNKYKILKIDVEKLMEEERIRLEKEEQLLSEDLQYFDIDGDMNMSSISSDDLSIFVKGT